MCLGALLLRSNPGNQVATIEGLLYKMYYSLSSSFKLAVLNIPKRLPQPLFINRSLLYPLFSLLFLLCCSFPPLCIFFFNFTPTFFFYFTLSSMLCPWLLVFACFFFPCFCATAYIPCLSLVSFSQETVCYRLTTISIWFPMLKSSFTWCQSVTVFRYKIFTGVRSDHELLWWSQVSTTTVF